MQTREVGRDKRGAPQPAGGANENESREGHTIRASKIDSMCRAETFGELAYVRRAAIPPAKDYHARINPISRSHDTLYRVELNITAMMYYQRNQFTCMVFEDQAYQSIIFFPLEVRWRKYRGLQVFPIHLTLHAYCILSVPELSRCPGKLGKVCHRCSPPRQKTCYSI